MISVAITDVELLSLVIYYQHFIVTVSVIYFMINLLQMLMLQRKAGVLVEELELKKQVLWCK